MPVTKSTAKIHIEFCILSRCPDRSRHFSWGILSGQNIFVHNTRRIPREFYILRQRPDRLRQSPWDIPSCQNVFTYTTTIIYFESCVFRHGRIDPDNSYATFRAARFFFFIYTIFKNPFWVLSRLPASGQTQTYHIGRSSGQNVFK